MVVEEIPSEANIPIDNGSNVVTNVTIIDGSIIFFLAFFIYHYFKTENYSDVLGWKRILAVLIIGIAYKSLAFLFVDYNWDTIIYVLVGIFSILLFYIISGIITVIIKSLINKN